MQTVLGDEADVVAHSSLLIPCLLWTGQPVEAAPSGWHAQNNVWFPPQAGTPTPIPVDQIDNNAPRIRRQLRAASTTPVSLGAKAQNLAMTLAVAATVILTLSSASPSGTHEMESYRFSDPYLVNSEPVQRLFQEDEPKEAVWNIHQAGSTLRVGENYDIPHGFYRSSPTSLGCSYELSRLTQEGLITVIGQDELWRGSMLVHIMEDEPDWFTSSTECGQWAPMAAGPKKREVFDGDWLYDEMVQGVWEAGPHCYYEHVATWRGSRLDDVLETSLTQNQTFVLHQETPGFGIRVRGCTEGLRLKE